VADDPEKKAAVRSSGTPAKERKTVSRSGGINDLDAMTEAARRISETISAFKVPIVPTFQMPVLPTFQLTELSNALTHIGNYSSLLSSGALSRLGSFSSTIPAAEETVRLSRQIDDLRKKLAAETSGSAAQRRTIAELKKTIDTLVEQERLRFLLDRVHPDAHQVLRESEEFRSRFLAGECSAFVMSVDIRRSTELMLKTRSAERFADFITALCTELNFIVLQSFGVFDKFTGDGILAFFPDFYSGKDAAFRVVDAADRCHAAFERHYRDSRGAFKTVLADVGLGIGIDHGSVRLVQVAGGLTVVGEPVVYACRLSGAPPNVTLTNQPAYEEISTRFGAFCFTEEQFHEIKHEGRMLAYRFT
jgi:class 3 adenylate cyclase